MNNKNRASISELLAVLSAGLSDSEVISAVAQSEIAASISRERIRRGMTQAEFADLLGVRQAQVSKWESEDYNFTLKKLAELAAKLNMSLKCSLSPRVKKSNPIISLSSFSQDSQKYTGYSYIPDVQYGDNRKEM